MSSMWDPIEPLGERFDLLHEAGAFVLVAAAVRPKIETAYGERNPVDLTVATTEPGVTRKFSGFGGALVAQVRQLGANDLPALVKFTTVSTPNGEGLAIGLIKRGRGATKERLAEVAAEQTIAIGPRPPEPDAPAADFAPIAAGEVPADDDIPF